MRTPWKVKYLNLSQKHRMLRKNARELCKRADKLSLSSSMEELDEFYYWLEMTKACLERQDADNN